MSQAENQVGVLKLKDFLLVRDLLTHEFLNRPTCNSYSILFSDGKGPRLVSQGVAPGSFGECTLAELAAGENGTESLGPACRSIFLSSLDSGLFETQSEMTILNAWLKREQEHWIPLFKERIEAGTIVADDDLLERLGMVDRFVPAQRVITARDILRAASKQEETYANESFDQSVSTYLAEQSDFHTVDFMVFVDLPFAKATDAPTYPRHAGNIREQWPEREESYWRPKVEAMWEEEAQPDEPEEVPLPPALVSRPKPATTSDADLICPGLEVWQPIGDAVHALTRADANLIEAVLERSPIFSEAVQKEHQFVWDTDGKVKKIEVQKPDPRPPEDSYWAKIKDVFQAHAGGGFSIQVDDYMLDCSLKDAALVADVLKRSRPIPIPAKPAREEAGAQEPDKQSLKSFLLELATGNELVSQETKIRAIQLMETL